VTFEPKFFVCPEHTFVVSVPKRGEINSRGTPVHRVTGCSGCDNAVNDAFDYAEATPGSLREGT
jgi:hypothetical protein